VTRKLVTKAAAETTQANGRVYHRWDYETPIEETMNALHDLVRIGKVRYLGASSMWV